MTMISDEELAHRAHCVVLSSAIRLHDLAGKNAVDLTLITEAIQDFQSGFSELTDVDSLRQGVCTDLCRVLIGRAQDAGEIPNVKELQ